MFKAMIAHLLSFFSVGIHGNKSRYDREIVEAFLGLFLAIMILFIALLMTVGALITITVRPDKTAARIYAAVISLGLETRQETQACAANINTGYWLLWKSKGELFEGRICCMCVNLVCICPKNCQVSIAKSFTCNSSEVRLCYCFCA